MSTFLGDYINYEIKLDDGPTIEVNEYAEHIEKVREIGDRISLKLSKERITVFDAVTKTSLMQE